MIDIIKKLNIEVSKPNVFQAVVAKQYDMNTRFIEATFVDGGNVIRIDPSATVTVVINALRPDGESRSFDGVVNSDGTVTVPIHSWMVELEGTVICDISVMDIKVDDNKKLTTTSFTLLVEKASNGGEGITSDPQYDLLVELLDRCDKADAMAKDALEKSTEANSKYDACVEATSQALQAAAGVTTIEQNSDTPLRFWVGTKAEYDAISVKDQTMFYIISDDNTEATYNERFEGIEENQGLIDEDIIAINKTFESYAPQDLTPQLQGIDSAMRGCINLIKSGSVVNLSLVKSTSSYFSINKGNNGYQMDLCTLPEEVRPKKQILFAPAIKCASKVAVLTESYIQINTNGVVRVFIFTESNSDNLINLQLLAFNTTYIVGV